jgi:hypothetical protein
MFHLIAMIALVLPGASGGGCSNFHMPQSLDGVVQAEKLWIKSLETKDVEGLACMLDQSFLDNSWTGTVRTRADLLGALPSRQVSTIELQDLKTRIEGSTGLATGIAVSHGSAGTVRARFTDVFLYRDGRWRAIAAQETGLKDIQ